MFKLKTQLPPTLLLPAGLVVVALLSSLGGLWHYQGEQSNQPPTIQLSVKSTQPAASKPASSAGQAAASPVTSGSPAASSGVVPAQTGQTADQSISHSPVGTASPASPPSSAVLQSNTVTVSLSVNSQPKGSLKLASGSNQCQVLSQALADGLISSLDMRYDSQLGSEGVYVIDGVGDPGSVWWTYSVNGHQPPLGCSYTTANNGDSVNWQYVKS